tara:strand:+ start:614 stop:1189 length:576 start_codon:yes stop_codon:yes gene_type:complete
MGLLLEAAQTDIPKNLELCCKAAPGPEDSIVACKTEKETLETAFGSEFHTVLIFGLIMTCLTTLFLLQWAYYPLSYVSMRPVPELVVIISWTITVFLHTMSFSFVSVVVLFSNKELYDCDPFSNHSLLAKGWVECITITFISIGTIYIIPRINPENHITAKYSRDISLTTIDQQQHQIKTLHEDDEEDVLG